MNLTIAGRAVSSAMLEVGVRCGKPPAVSTDKCFAIAGPKANCTEIYVTPAGLLAKLIPKFGGGEKLIPFGNVLEVDLIDDEKKK